MATASVTETAHRIPPVPSATAAMIDAARERVNRSDIVLSVAAPDQYDRVEQLSRAASREEMLSPLTAELIAWFVDRNPCGRGFVVTASDAVTDRVVGYFLFHPWELRRRAPDPTRLRTFLFVRLYVDPAYRRRKVFAAMTDFGLDLVAQLGVGIAYTVPNQRSAPGFLKFGMQQAGQLPFWVRPNLPGWGWVGGFRNRTGDMAVERRAAFDDTWQPDAERDLPESTGLWSPRPIDMLNWRYPERPEGDYEIRYVRRREGVVGYLVTRRMRIKGLRTLVVCDGWMDGFDAAAFRAAIEDALRSGPRVDLAVAFGGGGAPGYRRALRRSGFVVCPPRLQPQPVAVIGCGVGGARQRVAVPPVAEWHLTPFDWDVF